MLDTLFIADRPAPGPRAYRAFVLGVGGAIRSVIMLDAETDDDAKCRVASITNAFGIDLWERARFLGAFPPLDIP